MITLVTEYWRVMRGFSRDIWLFIAAWALMAFGYFGILGVLLNLYLLRLGYGPTYIGLLTGSGQLLWAALALPAAAVGLRIGPRNSMAIGNTLFASGTVLILLVEVLPNRLWSAWLVGNWLLVWTGAALITVNSIPYLMALSSEEERNYAFAAQSSAIAIFSFLGSLAAGAMPGLFAAWSGQSLDLPAVYRHGLWGTPILFLVGAGILMLARPVALPRPDRSETAAASRPVALLLFLALTTLLISAVEGSLFAFFNVYLDSALAVPTSRIGLVMGVARLLPAAAAMTAPALMGWLGAGNTFAFTSLAAGFFMLPLSFIAHWLAAAVSFMGVIGATATAGPARSVFSQLCVGPEWRTSASAALTIGLGLGWALMAALGGFIIDAWGFRVLFLLGGILAFTSALILYAYVRRQSASSAAPVPAD